MHRGMTACRAGQIDGGHTSHAYEITNEVFFAVAGALSRVSRNKHGAGSVLQKQVNSPWSTYR